MKSTLPGYLDIYFDVDSETILTADSRETGLAKFMELDDNPEQRIKTKATYGNFSTNSEAIQYLNVNLQNLLSNHKQKQMEIDYI